LSPIPLDDDEEEEAEWLLKVEAYYEMTEKNVSPLAKPMTTGCFQPTRNICSPALTPRVVVSPAER
jgi:hypothetical protein